MPRDPEENRGIHKCGRMAALLILWERGELDGYSYQHLADICHLGHRSTAMRNVDQLPLVRIERDRVLSAFRRRPRRIRKISRNL